MPLLLALLPVVEPGSVDAFGGSELLLLSLLDEAAVASVSVKVVLETAAADEVEAEFRSSKLGALGAGWGLLSTVDAIVCDYRRVFKAGDAEFTYIKQRCVVTCR